MAWEKRGNRYYYYRKRREGRRVVSEYVGAGDLAEAIAALDAWDRIEQEVEREIWQRKKESEAEVIAEMDQLGDLLRALTHAALLTAGYHTHKGQWRRKRGR